MYLPQALSAAADRGAAAGEVVVGSEGAAVDCTWVVAAAQTVAVGKRHADHASDIALGVVITKMAAAQPFQLSTRIVVLKTATPHSDSPHPDSAAGGCPRSRQHSISH